MSACETILHDPILPVVVLVLAQETCRRALAAAVKTHDFLLGPGLLDLCVNEKAGRRLYIHTCQLAFEVNF
jgi:hypothetical protein